MASARGNRLAPQSDYRRNPMRDPQGLTRDPETGNYRIKPGYNLQAAPPSRGPAQAPAQPSSGFFGGIGDSMDQTVQGIGRFFGGQGTPPQPPQRDPRQEWITDTRPRPSLDEGLPYLPYRTPQTPRDRYALPVQMPDLIDPRFDGGRGRRSPGYGPVPMPDLADFGFDGGLQPRAPRDGYVPPVQMPGGRRRNPGYGPVPMPYPFDPGFDGGRRDAFERPQQIEGGEGTDAELFDRFRRQRPVRPREVFQYLSESPIQDMGGMFNVPPEPSARGGNPMFPAEAARSFTQIQRNPLNIYSGGLQTQTRPLIPFEQRDPARPVVDFMPPDRPSPITFEDQTALAENPEFPQGQGPLRKFGESGSQLMGDYERGANTRMKNERLRALADEINARSGVRNPMVPNSPLRLDESGRQLPNIDPTSAAMKEGIQQGRRVDEFLKDTPIATSSGEARRNAQSVPPDLQNPMTMQPGNGYNGNIGYADDPSRYDPTDPAIQQRQRDNAQRSTAGQPVSRTRGQGGAMDAYIESGGVPWYEREAKAKEQMRIEAIKATPEYQAEHAQNQKEMMERRAMRELPYEQASPEEQDRRDRTERRQAENKAKHQAFKDANGGMSYRQYDRMTGSSNGNNSLTLKAVEDGRLSPAEANYRMQLRAEKAMRRSGNPMAAGTSMAGILYPDLMSGAGGRRPAGGNPMAMAAEAMRPGGNRTSEGRATAKSYLKNAFAGGTDESGTTVAPNTFLKDTGATGEENNIETMHFGIQKLVQDDVSPSDDDLQAVYAAVVAMDSAYGTPDYDPFDMTYGMELTGTDRKHTETFGPMYKDLLKLKNPKKSDLQSWWAKFKSRISPNSQWGAEGPVSPPPPPRPGDVTPSFPIQYPPR